MKVSQKRLEKHRREGEVESARIDVTPKEHLLEEARTGSPAQPPSTVPVIPGFWLYETDTEFFNSISM